MRIATGFAAPDGEPDNDPPRLPKEIEELLQRACQGDGAAGNLLLGWVRVRVLQFWAAGQPTANGRQAVLRRFGALHLPGAEGDYLMYAFGLIVRQLLVQAKFRSGSNDNPLGRLDERLAQLAQRHPRGAEVVALKYFVGLPETEIAGMLALSARTVKRELHAAKAWLAQS